MRGGIAVLVVLSAVACAAGTTASCASFSEGAPGSTPAEAGTASDGSTAADGASNDDGAATEAGSCVGYAARFTSGGGKWFQVLDGSAFDPTDLTVEAWVFIPSAQKSANMHVVSHIGQDKSSGGWALAVEAGRLAWKAFTIGVGESTIGGSANADPRIVIPLDQWAHIAATHSGTDVTLYVNGVAGPSASTFVVRTPTIPANRHVRIGAAALDPAQPFVGLVDEVRVSSSLRYYDGNVTRAPFVPDVETIGLWHFDEADGNAREASGLKHVAVALPAGSEIERRCMPAFASDGVMP